MDWKQKASRMPVWARGVVRRELGLEPGPLLAQLRSGPWCQADVVLVLLREETPRARREVEELTGLTITTLPPAVPTWPPRPPAGPGVRAGDDRRFTKVGVMPYRRVGKQSADWGNFRVGRTVADYLARGGRRRWLREALASREVELEEEGT